MDSRRSASVTGVPAPSSWRAFTRTFLGGAILSGAAALTFVAVLDPYGLRAAPGRAPGPIMDTNQRLSYPQIARGGPFDAAVFGTSTARLLDPHDLDAAFAARFANLAVNAATPDEQIRLAELFLARRPLRAVLFGLDATWCAVDPPARPRPGSPGSIWHGRGSAPTATPSSPRWNRATIRSAPAPTSAQARRIRTRRRIGRTTPCRR
jgi:hypothetical protein